LIIAGIVAGIIGFKATEFLIVRIQESAAFSRFESILLNTSSFLEVGLKFPDFTLVQVETQDSVQLSDVLSLGGVIIYLPSDYLWLDLNLEMFSRAIPTYKSTGGHPVIIVTAGPGVPAFVARVRAHRIDLDIHEDFTGVLRDVCHVPNEPVFFCLDEEFRLRRAGFLGASSKALERALE